MKKLEDDIPITEEAYKILMRAYFPDCEFREGIDVDGVIMRDNITTLGCFVDGSHRVSAYLCDSKHQDRAVVYLWNFLFDYKHELLMWMLYSPSFLRPKPMPFSIACIEYGALRKVMKDHYAKWIRDRETYNKYYRRLECTCRPICHPEGMGSRGRLFCVK